MEKRRNQTQNVQSWFSQAQLTINQQVESKISENIQNLYRTEHVNSYIVNEQNNSLTLLARQRKDRYTMVCGNF